MFKFDENYYLRKCFFNRQQVPTQSAMRKKMGGLAPVYFKSMTYKLKVLAGLEPPLKGGGSDWYVEPEELLKGRAVMKPIEKQHLKKLGYAGIEFFGEKLVADYKRELQLEKKKALEDSDNDWKHAILRICQEYYDEIAAEEAHNNTEKLKNACDEFETLYRTSCNRLEDMLIDAANIEIEKVKAETHKKMYDLYEALLKKQATMLYDRYSKKLEEKKAKIKKKFEKDLNESRTSTANHIHDINVDKHVAVEKLRKLMECQNVACQVYVALKEREECRKEMEQAQYDHKKEVKKLDDQIHMKDYEIQLHVEKEQKRKEFERIWKKKVCHIVKKFQIFVSYCLNNLPEYADFFLNMEKLMLLQLNDAAEAPDTKSLFVPESDGFKTPVPQNKPFLLVGEVGRKPVFDEKLCPKKVSSSPSQLPVIVINKHCIYSACDNMEMFTERMKEFLHGKRGDDEDFVDHHDYTLGVPVTHTPSQHLRELELQDSLMQILQNELPNIHNVSVECCVCKLPYCFCTPSEASKVAVETSLKQSLPPAPSVSAGKKIDSRSVELVHEREPKWDSFMEYIKPVRCKCPGTAKKHLKEHLPTYMTKMSKYSAVEIPNYEMCDLETLKQMVKKAQKLPPPYVPPRVESKTRDVEVQFSDPEFDIICNCFSENELKQWYRSLVDEAVELGKREVRLTAVEEPADAVDATTFATARAYSLRNLLNEAPILEEIFQNKDCNTYSPK